MDFFVFERTHYLDGDTDDPSSRISLPPIDSVPDSVLYVLKPLGPESKRITEIDRVTPSVPVQVEPPCQPDRVFLGALDRLEGPSYSAALQVG